MHIAKKLNKLVSIEDAFEKELHIKVTAGQSICCPFHSDKTPSMKVYGGDKGAYCFGQCGKAYTPYSTIQFTHPGYSYKELLQYIEQEYKIKPEADDEDDDIDSYETKAETNVIAEQEKIYQYIKDNPERSNELLKKLEIALYHILDSGNHKYWHKLLDEVYGIDENNTMEL